MPRYYLQTTRGHTATPPVPSASSTPDLVQYVSKATAIGAGGAWSVGTNISLPFPNPGRSGNCMVVFVQVPGDWPIADFAATDNIGTNTWVRLKGSYNATGDVMLMAFYALNVAAGTRTVNVSQNTSTGLFGFQSMGMEFCNVTAIDGAALSTTGNSSTMTTASITPAQTGDLIVYAGVRVTSVTTTSFTAGSQSNITWKLAGPNIFNGFSMQWGVYNSTSAINPQMTMATSTQWTAMALAFKAGASGTARPSTGIYVIGNTGIDFRPGNFATTQVMQVSRYGNLGIVGFVGGVAANAPTITAITDTESTSWSTAFTSVVNDSRVGMLYGPNATPNPSSLMTLTLNISTGDFTAQCLDVSGAAVSPLGAFGTNTGNQSVAGDNSCISITPTASNGLVYCEMGVAFNTNVSLTAPSAGTFISATFDNQDLDGPSTPDENNAWALWYNPNTSAQTFTFHMRSPSEANGNWAAGIAEFKAA